MSVVYPISAEIQYGGGKSLGKKGQERISYNILHNLS